MARLTEKRLECQVDFSERLNGLELISVNVGPTGQLIALALGGELDYSETHEHATFPKTKSAGSHDYVVFVVNGSSWDQFSVRNEQWNYHFAQTLPSDELLLVCARCRKHPDGTHDLNARVFDYDGRMKREFLLGDGINRVQTLTDGRIWTSYFDEGVFGNFG